MAADTPAPGGTAKLAGRTVARIGFGAMQLDHAERDTALAILRQAVRAGVNHIDTAHFYGNEGPPGLVAKGEQKVDLDDQLAELSALRDAGKMTSTPPKTTNDTERRNR